MWRTKSVFRDNCSLFKLSLDRDECSDNSHDCNENAICSNTRGSYICKCKMGFMGDGKNCEGMSLVGQYYLLFKVSKTTKIKLIKTETAFYKMRENVGINLITTTKFLINNFPSFFGSSIMYIELFMSYTHYTRGQFNETFTRVI